MGVPNVFGSATTSIPLSQLDANFNTGLTIGNTTIGLGNTTTTLGNVTLSNVSIVSSPNANVTIGNTTIGIGNTATSLGNVTLANSTINFAASLSLGNSTVNTALGQGNASIMKNRIINGAMVIDQRNAGATVTPTSGGFGLDRWKFYLTEASKLTVGQSTTAPVGFGNSMLVTSSSSLSVPAADLYILQQNIEGFNTADLNWGTANAKTVTLSFWVRSSLTGTFGGAINNSSWQYSYPFSYTISAADTWEQKTITVVGPTAGTWIGATNGIGAVVTFGLGVGSNNSGTAGAWAASQYFSSTGAVSVVGTNGATWYVTGVQLEVGSSATGFEYVNYQTSLANCQRYFWRMNGKSGGNATFAAGQVYNSADVRAVLTNPVPMRADTTVSFTGTNFGYANSGSVKTLGTLNAADQTAQTALLYSGAGTTSSTQGQAAFWVITNIDSYISVSAEL